MLFVGLLKNKLFHCCHFTRLAFRFQISLIAKIMVRQSRQSKLQAKQNKHVPITQSVQLHALDASQASIFTTFLDYSHPIVAYVLFLLKPVIVVAFLAILHVYYQISKGVVSCFARCACSKMLIVRVLRFVASLRRAHIADQVGTTQADRDVDELFQMANETLGIDVKALPGGKRMAADMVKMMTGSALTVPEATAEAKEFLEYLNAFSSFPLKKLREFVGKSEFF